MRGLAEIARTVASDWKLQLGPPFALSRHSLVVPAGDEAVLKVSPIDDEEALHEGDSLEHWNGRGAVRLLRRDRARGALLLERASPGDDLSAVAEDVAIKAVVAVGAQLWQAGSGRFRSIADEVPGWLARTVPETSAGRELLALARAMFGSMAPDASVVIHGDLHHHNVVRSARGWLAIDPKPLLGEREFDVVPFLWNPLDVSFTIELAERRLATFADAGLSATRMRAWAVIRGAYLRTDANELKVLRALAGTSRQETANE